MHGKENKIAVITFWGLISLNQWNEIPLLLTERFEAYWPQSKEKMDRDEFMALIKKESANIKFEVLNVNHEYDQWDHLSTVITQVQASSNLTSDKNMTESHIISFFEVSDEKINGLVEYRT